jgi:hypothetical protein
VRVDDDQPPPSSTDVAAPAPAPAHEHRVGLCGPECKERPPAQRWVALASAQDDTELFEPEPWDDDDRDQE